MSGKILLLELLLKMLSTDRIEEFLKVQFLNNGSRYEINFSYVSDKSIWLGLAWIVIAKVLQNYKSGIYPKSKYG